MNYNDWSGDRQCDNFAEYSYKWPGRKLRLSACSQCIEIIEKEAERLGIDIQIQKLENSFERCDGVSL